MPFGPQPCRRDSSCTSHSVSDPTVETLTVLPCRSATDLIGLSFATSTVRSEGASAKAATPIAGTPLAMNASSGPEPSPISMLPEASPCCSFALPAKSYFSTSSPYFLKMPVSMPTSRGTNENASEIALPTRIFVSARASSVKAPLTAATTRKANVIRRTACEENFDFLMKCSPFKVSPSQIQITITQNSPLASQHEAAEFPVDSHRVEPFRGPRRIRLAPSLWKQDLRSHLPALALDPGRGDCSSHRHRPYGQSPRSPQEPAIGSHPYF